MIRKTIQAPTARVGWILLVSIASVSAGRVPLILEFQDSVRVVGAEIRLRDLLLETTEAGDLGDIVVGESAPPGYARHVNTRDLLSYHLRSCGRDVRVESHKRVLVTTVAYTFQVSDFKKDIKRELDSLVGWPKGTWTVRIIDSTKSFRTHHPEVNISLKRLPNRPFGATALRLRIVQSGDTAEMDIRCRFEVHSPVLVAASDLSRGTRLSAVNVRRANKELLRSTQSPFVELSEIEGFELKRSVSAGTVLDMRMVSPIPSVREGDLITISLAGKDFTIHLNARARESGVVGEDIWVENLVSHKLLKVRVSGQGRAVVTSMEGT